MPSPHRPRAPALWTRRAQRALCTVGGWGCGGDGVCVCVVVWWAGGLDVAHPYSQTICARMMDDTMNAIMGDIKLF